MFPPRDAARDDVQGMHASTRTSSEKIINPNRFGLANGFPALTKFSSGRINLGPITMNEQGSKFIRIKCVPELVRGTWTRDGKGSSRLDLGVIKQKRVKALPTETKVESGTSQSKSRTSVK